jgi:hypothetical protein
VAERSRSGSGRLGDNAHGRKDPALRLSLAWVAPAAALAPVLGLRLVSFDTQHVIAIGGT